MRRRVVALVVLLSGPCALTARAGVVNPDISVLGQPFMQVTDAKDDPSGGHLRLDQGETEFVYDSYLNPYAKGFFVASLSRDGFDLEEGYFTLLRGLPAGLQLKGGKYLAGFGKLNAQHAHIWPFAERPRVLAAYLPGSESLDEVGISLSELVPVAGASSLTLTADWLQGDTFRRARTASGATNDPLNASSTGDRADESRGAALGRASSFVPLGDRSGIELGVSALSGVNNVAADARTTIFGGDLKAKLWTTPNGYVVVQGEVLQLARDDAGWDSTAAHYTTRTTRPLGGYLYADWNPSQRWNAGALYERWQAAEGSDVWNQGIGVFAGLHLMEETTSFRVDWKHDMPGTPSGAPAPDAVNTLTVSVIYSMGPHKAHQF